MRPPRSRSACRAAPSRRVSTRPAPISGRCSMPELHDLKAPSPAPGFRDRLFERTEERARRQARRWRLVALVAIVLAITSMTGAGVLAFATTGQSATTTFDE